MRPWPPWLSRLSTSVLSSAAANCSKLHSSARARSASLGNALAAAGPSAPGTGARAPSSGGSCDQRVVGRQRTDLDVRFVRTAALVALELERAGVLERGDRLMLGEAARVTAGVLAAVQRHRQDL